MIFEQRFGLAGVIDFLQRNCKLSLECCYLVCRKTCILHKEGFGFSGKICLINIIYLEGCIQHLDKVVLYDRIVLFATFFNTVVVVVGEHIIVHNLVKGCAHKTFKQSTYKACAVFSFVTMNQIRAVVVNNVAHTLCDTVQGCFGEEIHTQIHVYDLTGAVIGVVRTLVGVGGIGKVDDGHNACIFGSLVCIGVTSKCRIDGRRRTIQYSLANACGIDFTEVGECLVTEVCIIATLIGTNQLTNQPLFTVTAFLFHSDCNLNRGVHQIIPTVSGILIDCGLCCNSRGGSKVAHIDSQNYSVCRRGSAQNNLAVIYVTVACAKRNVPLFISNGNLYNVAVFEALVKKVRTVHIQDQIAVLGDLVYRGLYLNGFGNCGIIVIIGIICIVCIRCIVGDIAITTIIHCAARIIATDKHGQQHNQSK